MIKSLTARCEELSACVADFSSTNSNLSYLLQLLMATAQKNCKREKHGRRYDLEVKYFSTYLFIVAGPFVYEFLYHNFINALPSLSEVQRTLATSTAPVKEGQFRFDELDSFLNDHELPRKVFISEDGTRVLQRFLYDLTSDQIIGVVPPLAENGVPIINSFPASSAAMISNHFEKGEPSSSAYVIMAQPLQDKAPCFCLCIFGTANKFTSEHVYKRWTYIYEELAQRGIEVIGFSSDGDPKLLSAMHSHMFQAGTPCIDEFRDFYFASSGRKFTVIQDFIHTVNKFRSRLNPTHLLPLGKYSASQSHLRILIEERSKEEHGLTTSDLDKADKMNFNSSVKICSERVTCLLEKHIPGSEGTVAYLTVMRNVMESGMNESLSPLERLYKIWYAVIFLRHWKSWLTSDPRFSLENFVTRNLYMCVEIIGHAIVDLIVKFRDENCPESLLIHMFNSQTSEGFFRHLRSMTTTESTVINFSMKEILQKVRRIDMLHHVSSKLSGKLVFPREKRKRLIGTLTAEKLQETYLPSNEEIQLAVREATNDAIADLRRLGVVCPRAMSMTKIKTALLSCKNFESDDNECDRVDSIVPMFYEASIDEDDIPLDLLATFPSPESVIGLDPHGENDSSSVALPCKTSHVLVPDSKGGFKSLSKSLFCWILCSVGGTHLDNIRIHRVRDKILSSLGSIRNSNARSVPSEKRNEVAIGNWCIFRDGKCFVVAQIIGFCYLSGKSKSYTLLKAPTKPPQGKLARGIGCLGLWYTVQVNKLKIRNSQNKYLDIVKYVATIPSPIPVETGFELRPETASYLENLS